MKPIARTLLVSLIVAATATAQDVSEAEQARIKAAIGLYVFDDLEAQCGSGFDAAQRAEVASWSRKHSVPRVRAHLDGAGLSDHWRSQARAGAQQVIRQVASGANPCVAAVSITRTADMQFDAKLPLLMQGAAASSATSSAAARNPAPAPVPAAAPAKGGNIEGAGAKLAASIEGFGFDTCSRMGYGGMIMVVACPVVLFRNGEALTDVEGLNHPQGLPGHRAARPAKWTHWRRSGGKVQLQEEGAWENLGFTAVYSTLPADFRLDGRFRSLGGAGTAAIGGSQAVVAWSDYVFSPDGRVRRDGGAGASASAGSTSVTTGSQAPVKSGRYRVEGLVLAMDFDDGSRERRLIIADPKDNGKGSIWLDGEGYAIRK